MDCDYFCDPGSACNGGDIMPSFGKQSINNRNTLHPLLRDILDEAILEYDFSIICGYRDREEQTAAFKSGNSKAEWPLSNHNSWLSLAVDVAPYYKNRPHIRWKEHNEFFYLAGLIMAIAKAKGIKIRWGGRFKSIFDPAHFEILP